MTTTRVFIGAALMMLLSCVLWAELNQPRDAPPWPALVQGFSFSPVREGENPNRHIYPAPEEIDQDLQLLKGRVRAVRLYTVEDVFADVPGLAAQHGINVTLGAWISDDIARNEAEIAKVIDIARANKNVVRVVVGNESLLRGDISADELIQYLERVRHKVRVPVSTAEPWNVWLAHPELGAHVDFVAAHVLPYWEGIAIDRAVDFVARRHDQLQAAFPRLPIVLAEVGWPSKGRVRQGAVASPVNQAIFLREFLALAARENYIYYLMEAFDQPWKREFEGDVGAYWGVYDAARHAKFPFAGPIYPLPHWPALAAAAATLAFISFLLLGRDGRALRHRGLLFLGVVALGLGSAVVWLIDSYAHQYWTATSIAVGALLTLGLTMVATVLLVETHEWAEALWVRQRRRPLPVFDDPAAELPKVSIHVPTHNEPPDMVIATLDALARIDHADYEVLVIDNNTREPSLWQPVERHCAVLGARFRFFHVGNMAGYKAGALNFALRHTAPDAGVIAIVDSDYQVRPDWLRSLLPSFADPRVAIVQAPQDYHDGSQNPFKAMCCEEYRGFFHIGMITRNDRNAIIQHGTMTLIRRHVLEEVGGWGEWCITEDAELGLRVFEKGYHALYTPRSYGQGLTPDTFLDYKKQRYRWAYGAMQILRAHAGALLRGGSSSLTRGQRFHFIAGWLPWLADGVNLFFTLAAVAWAAAMLVAPLRVDPPLPLFVMPPLMLFAFKLGKLVHLYRRGVGASWRQTASAALAGLALSHTIAKAVVAGCLTRNQPFICTPKMKTASPLLRALASAQEEAALLLLLWSLVFGLSRLPGAEGGDMRLWMAMLVVQSLPYLAAVTTAMISALPGVQRATRTEPATRPAPAEGR